MLYIPKLDRLQASRRIERIRAEWNGRNNEELARKYGVSTRWVQKAVEGLAEPPLPGQVAMEAVSYTHLCNGVNSKTKGT